MCTTPPSKVMNISMCRKTNFTVPPLFYRNAPTITVLFNHKRSMESWIPLISASDYILNPLLGCNIFFNKKKKTNEPHMTYLLRQYGPVIVNTDVVGRSFKDCALFHWTAGYITSRVNAGLVHAFNIYYLMGRDFLTFGIADWVVVTGSYIYQWLSSYHLNRTFCRGCRALMKILERRKCADCPLPT